MSSLDLISHVIQASHFGLQALLFCELLDSLPAVLLTGFRCSKVIPHTTIIFTSLGLDDKWHHLVPIYLPLAHLRYIVFVTYAHGRVVDLFIFTAISTV